jgi:hypothetical protein
VRSARDSQSIEASSDNPTRERKPTQFSNSYYGSTLLTSRVLYSVNVINNRVDDTAASTQMALSPEPSTTPASKSIHHRLLHPSCSASYILTTDTARMMRLELGGLRTGYRPNRNRFVHSPYLASFCFGLNRYQYR